MSLSHMMDYAGLAVWVNANELERAMFLHTNIPAKSFAYPAHDGVLDVDHW